jgi:hypothetical protein
MLLKCNDFKTIDFDDKLIQFSSTLKAIQKYQNSNGASIDFCNSTLMNIVQEWLSTMAHNNFGESTLKDNIDFFNKIISVKYKNKFIIIDLLEIADFLLTFFLC